MSFSFETLESTKIGLYEPVSSQKYENGYRTKICDFFLQYSILLVESKKSSSIRTPRMRTSACDTSPSLSTAL